MSDITVEQIQAIIDGLERLTPSWAGAMVSALGSRERQFVDFGNDGDRQRLDRDKAVWLADNLPAVKALAELALQSLAAPQAQSDIAKTVMSETPQVSEPAGEVVAWLHPTAGWATAKYHSVLSHCRKDGPRPVALVRQPALTNALAEVERLKTLNADLLMQAKGHATEAKTANATIHEIYQVLRGGKGEPGNWNGAEPARRYVEAAENAIMTETEACAAIIRDNMLCSDRNDVEVLLPRGDSGNRVGEAYEAAIRERLKP